MNNSIQSTHDLRAEVMASPAYQERVGLLFELFQASRQPDGTPNSLLGIQAAIAKLLMDWQDKQREFKHDDNQLGIAVVKRLILILQRIADSIAWRALSYDRVLVQLLAEHSKTGFLDETIFGDFEGARKITENGNAVVLVNDLTTILRHGDLTVIYPDTRGMQIIENKSGKSRDGRSNRQKKFLSDLLNFLNTGIRISKDGTKDYLFRVDTPLQTHHAKVAEVMDQARKKGYQKMLISDCLVIEAVFMDHPNAHLPKERPFENVEHTISEGNMDEGIFYMPATRIAPYGIFPFDDRTCFDLIIGNMQLISTLNFDALVTLFAQMGLILEIPQPSQQEIAKYLSASIIDIKKAQKYDRASWFIIRDGNYFLRISPDNWARISLELIHEKTFAQTHHYLINQFRDLEIPEDRTTRIYIGYKNESNIWS